MLEKYIDKRDLIIHYSNTENTLQNRKWQVVAPVDYISKYEWQKRKEIVEARIFWRNISPCCKILQKKLSFLWFFFWRLSQRRESSHSHNYGKYIQGIRVKPILSTWHLDYSSILAFYFTLLSFYLGPGAGFYKCIFIFSKLLFLIPISSYNTWIKMRLFQNENNLNMNSPKTLLEIQTWGVGAVSIFFHIEEIFE